MSSIQLVCLALVAVLFGMSHAQCVGRVRSVVPVTPVCPPPCTYGPPPCNEVVYVDRPHNSCNSGINADQIINKLVNALIFTATQGGGSGGGSRPSGSGSLIDLNLLGRNKNGGIEVLGLDLAGTGVADIGLGGIV